MSLKKFVIIGPESTGKSTLCQELAGHFKTDWVAEYAREYLLTHGKSYTYEDLIVIAKGQLALEDAAADKLLNQIPEPGNPHSISNIQQPKCLFIDTDMYVMKVWGEFVYGKCDSWILRQIADRHYDGYLLCRTDLPWTADELREYPDLLSRDRLFHMYRDALINQHTPWAEISGLSDQRLTMAIEVINSWI